MLEWLNKKINTYKKLLSKSELTILFDSMLEITQNKWDNLPQNSSFVDKIRLYNAAAVINNVKKMYPNNTISNRKA